MSTDNRTSIDAAGRAFCQSAGINATTYNISESPITHEKLKIVETFVLKQGEAQSRYGFRPLCVIYW